MRILITGIANYVSFNGQTVFMINLAQGLARRGHEVVLLLPSDQGRAYTANRNGVTVRTISSVNLRFLHPEVNYPPFPAGMIRQVLDDFRPEIIHVHDHFNICSVAIRIARARQIKVVGTSHFMPENFAPHLPLYNKYKKIMDRLMWGWVFTVFNRLDGVSTPSRTSARILLSKGINVPVVPISNGVDLWRFRPLTGIDRRAWRERYSLGGDRKVFLFVGRVDGEKRLDVLIRALALLQREDIQLAIAGRGTALYELKELAAGLGLGQKVVFTGFIPAEDLPSLLNSADIFAMPSQAELLSIATLEAMACARPVLAADAWALPELVSEGINGYLFKPGDEADAARKMALLADGPEKWAAMAAASLEKVQAHSLENTITSYEEFYMRVLAGVWQPGTKAVPG